MRGPHFLVAGILFSLFGALGCAQGVGGRCVQDSDCASGRCSLTSPMGGTCLSNTAITSSGTGGSLGTGGSGGLGGMGTGGQDAAPPNDAAPDALSGTGGAGGQGGSGGSSSDAQADAPSDH